MSCEGSAYSAVERECSCNCVSYPFGIDSASFKKRARPLSVSG